MCGLAGTFSTNGFFDADDIHNMTGILTHRGPDAEGFYSDEIVQLGHRRLSIIDLLKRSNQPMFSHDGRYVAIYNGEIYNYSEISPRLYTSSAEGKEMHLRTSGDTEIALEAFVKFGVDFVQLLNGMFVIIIYDTLKKELFLFRDRVGIKPLFYYYDEKNFAFASELKSLLTIKNIKKEINPDAVRQFLNLGYIPAPYTIYKNIYKMKSGYWMKVSADGVVQNCYWSLTTILKNDVITDAEEAMVKLSDLLISSVQYQLRSDVPSGVFLSGGVDSSLITAQAVMLSAMKINSFSIGFEEVSHSEAEYARKIADFLGTNHHEFIVSYKDAIDLIDSMLESYDEPYADSSAIPTMLVSKLARKFVTVALSGDGGDELFFGYGSYRWAHRLDNPLVYALRKPLSNLLSVFPYRYKRVGKLLDIENRKNLQQHIFSQEQYLFSQSELDDLLRPPYKGTSKKTQHQNIDEFLATVKNMFGPNGTSRSKTRKFTSMEEQALFDIQYYLQDDLLTKVDRASMKYSLEARVPYLDHRVIEFALNLSPDLKYKNGTQKYILKKILYQYLPRKYFDRPKQGFAIPLGKWLHNELNYLVEEYLSKAIIEKYNIVEFDKVEQMRNQFNSGTDFLYNRLWALIVIHKWFASNTK